MAFESDLVLEDGTGVELANTYALVATADTYHALYGNTAWEEADADQKATALVNATQYIDLRWSFVGVVTSPADPLTTGQGLSWPRTAADSSNLVDCKGDEWGEDEVPTQIIEATLEYALVSLAAGRLLPDPSVVDTSDRRIKKTREKIGPIEEEIEYSDVRSPRSIRKYATADRIVRASGFVSLVSGGRTARA